MTERQIAEQLNIEGVLTDLCRAWTRGTVHQILAALSTDRLLQEQICAEVTRRMATYGERREPADLAIRTAVFATDDLTPWSERLVTAQVLSFVIDVGRSDASRCVPNIDGWHCYEALGF